MQVQKRWRLTVAWWSNGTHRLSASSLLHMRLLSGRESPDMLKFVSSFFVNQIYMDMKDSNGLLVGD